jgi:uncharacterized membrane protein
MKAKLFVPVALVIGLVYVFITPPFRVPDEAAHFWRGLALANGVVSPQPKPPAEVRVPNGYRTFVWHMLNVPAGDRNSIDQIELALHIALEKDNRQIVHYPALYTPVPYLPQAAVASAGQRFGARPIVVFYAGRVANLLIAIVLIALAMRAAPELGAIAGAVALLPMSMYLLASWSADAITIALGVLFTALALRGRNVFALSLVAFALGMCKPAYFLVAIVVWFTQQSMARRIAATVSMVVGTAISLVYVRSGFFNMRPDLPIDPAAQWKCIAADPVRLAGLIVRDFSANGRFYVEQLIGRLGFNDLSIPQPVILLELLLLLTVALTSRITISAAARAVSVAIFAGTVIGILVSQYLIWSVVCGALIEGVQGRYFLPVLALLLGAMSVPRLRPESAGIAVTAVAVFCNAAAVYVMMERYW